MMAALLEPRRISSITACNTTAKMALDYGIHFLEPELCVNAVREFLAEQRS